MEEQKNAESILHKMAMRAKERLKKGNYEEQKVQIVKRPCALRLICGESIKAEIEITKVEKTIDEKLYKKVQKMLECDELNPMPLGKLIDKEFYKQLSDIEQERYMFDLSDNYIKLKNYFETKKINVA